MNKICVLWSPQNAYGNSFILLLTSDYEKYKDILRGLKLKESASDRLIRAADIFQWLLLNFYSSS
jgi:hypothetical protein